MRSSFLIGQENSSHRASEGPSWLADAIRAAEMGRTLNSDAAQPSLESSQRLDASYNTTASSSDSSLSFINVSQQENSNRFSNAPTDEKELKRRFNECVRSQKECKKNGDVEGQIRALRGAIAVRPENQKVRGKLDKLLKKQADALARKLEQMEEAQAAAAAAKAVAAAGAASELLEKAPKAEVVVVDGFKYRPGGKSYQLAKGYKLPTEVFEKLFKYQRDAVRWMWDLHRREAGGVLADEMGLGKTVQVAAFLRGLFASKLVETVLIVMPKSVVENWRKELSHWTRRPVLVYEGTKLQRERVLQEVAAGGGVVLTTYGMVRTNTVQLAGLESPRSGELEQWDYVILDEGHKIKNSASEGARSIKQIESPHKLVLTGTPVLNQLMELWALYDYVQPGLLGDLKTFRSTFDDPIVRASHKNAKADLKQHGELMLQKLKELIRPHFLRRVKEEVFAQRAPSETDPAPAAASASTSASGGAVASDANGVTVMSDSDRLLLEKHRIKVRKNDLICWVSLSAVQLELYDKFLTLPEVKEIFNSSKSPLAAITILKKICLHPRLLHSNMKTLRETIPDGGSELLEGSVASLLAKIALSEEDSVVTEQSGKLSFTLKLVDNLLACGHRVLIFSQWQKMLDIIGQALRVRSIGFLRMDGNMSKTEDRQRLIDTFNRRSAGSADVFLLTTQVGGLGITLTGADRAIIYDPSWNCTDDQAVDRIYRIGQQRNCIIYRLITCGTVEEKIYRKQVFKGGLSRMVSAGVSASSKLDGAADMGVRYFTKDELRALFTLENPHESVTQQQLHLQNSSRRHTDSELDSHLQFLASIPNFHGVSDHDLLFSGEPQPQSQQEQPLQRELATGDCKGKEEEAEAEEEEQPAGDRSMVAEAMLNDISVVLQDEELSHRGLESDDDGAGDLGLRVQGMSLQTPSPPPPSRKVKSPRTQRPEIHYRGPDAESPNVRAKKKQNSAADSAAAAAAAVATLDAAERLQEQERWFDALSNFMDVFESVPASHPAHPQLAQKILFLRKTISEQELDAGSEREDQHNDCYDGEDVELFDDEAEEIPPSSSHRRRGPASSMVIDSPVSDTVAETVVEMAPSIDNGSRFCVVCMDGPKEICFVPCGHVSCCADCANGKPGIKICPICRSKILQKVKIFVA